MTSMLDAALSYAARGLPVFPCNPRNKMPCLSKAEGGHGYKDATTDEATIRAWWTRWPNAMIGMPTGEATGLAILDVDVKDGVNGYAASSKAKLPQNTPQVATPSGGLHLYYRAPDGVKIKSATGGALEKTFGPGLDTRGEGGYVIVPPSVNADGQAYKWNNDFQLADALPVPPHLLQYVAKGAKRKNGHGHAGGHGGGPLPASLADAVKQIAAAASGHRHGELNKQSFFVGQLVGAGRLDESEARARLIEAGLAAMGAGRAAEIERTVDEALAAGKAAPLPEGKSADDEAELEKLARMPAFDYERARAEVAKRLGVRAAMLDKLVAAKRSEMGLDADDGRQGHAVSLPEPEPWPEPVDGGTVLTELATTIRRHVIMTEAAGDAAALWIAHTYCSDRFLISPRLAVLSATKQCGKTVTLDVLTRLVWRPLPAINATVAALFRTIEEFRPTLLLDEADTFLTGENEELRGLINGGYRQGANVLRIEGDDHQVRAFRTFAPCAIAAIGTLPATVMDRSIVINLARRKADEPIAPFRLDRTEVFDVLARKVARWVKDNADAIGACEPEQPDGLYNRVFDNWKGLLQIAGVAGGDWPARARKAAMAGAPDIDEASLLELLLGDIRGIFDGQADGRISSEALIGALVQIVPRPWAEYGKGGKPISQNKLARLLKPLKITTENIRVGDKTPKGYVFKHFDEAFARYLPPEGGFKPPQRHKADEMGTSDAFQTATPETDVADGKCEKSANDGPCGVVAVEKGGAGENAHVRTPKPKSDDLPYDGPVVPAPGQGPGPLDEHGRPIRCAQCGRPGGNRSAYGDGPVRHLHPWCEAPYIDRRMREEGVE